MKCKEIKPISIQSSHGSFESIMATERIYEQTDGDKTIITSIIVTDDCALVDVHRTVYEPTRES